MRDLQEYRRAHQRLSGEAVGRNIDDPSYFAVQVKAGGLSSDIPALPVIGTPPLVSATGAGAGATPGAVSGAFVVDFHPVDGGAAYG